VRNGGIVVMRKVKWIILIVRKFCKIPWGSSMLCFLVHRKSIWSRTHKLHMWTTKVLSLGQVNTIFKMPSVRNDGIVVTQKVNHHQDQHQAAVTNLGRLLHLQWMGALPYHGMATPKPKGALNSLIMHLHSWIVVLLHARIFLVDHVSFLLLNYFNHL
jgi:hypothetical protein